MSASVQAVHRLGAERIQACAGPWALAGITRFADVLLRMDGAATFCAIARCEPRCDMQRQLGEEAGKHCLKAKPPPGPKPDES